MNSVKSENEKLLEKAKNYNRTRMIWACTTVILSFIITEIYLHVPIFSIENVLFKRFYLMISIVEILSYFVLTYLLDTGNKMYRYLYWVAFFISASIVLYPFTSIFSSITTSIPYIGLVAILGIKVLILWRLGQYLQNDPNAQYVYDRVLFVDELKKEKEVSSPIKTPKIHVKKENPTKKTMPTIRKGNDGIAVYYEDSSYTKLSTRFAAIVYGSLMIFPILIQLLHNWFVSFDFTNNFALRGMFIACIVSAMVWTIAIFYMYYNQPQTKWIVRFCWIVEIIRVIYYSTVLYGYYKMDYYPIRAFILFILMDAIRYYALFYFSKQLFAMETPIPTDEDE